MAHPRVVLDAPQITHSKAGLPEAPSLRFRPPCVFRYRHSHPHHHPFYKKDTLSISTSPSPSHDTATPRALGHLDPANHTTACNAAAHHAASDLSGRRHFAFAAIYLQHQRPSSLCAIGPSLARRAVVRRRLLRLLGLALRPREELSAGH